MPKGFDSYWNTCHGDFRTVDRYEGHTTLFFLESTLLDSADDHRDIQ